MDDQRARLQARLRDALAAQDTLAALGALDALRSDLERLERDCVRFAFEDGQSFAGVARALGISRQAAHRRYRGVEAGERLLRAPMSIAARATLNRAREEAERLGSEHVDGVHVILALIADGYVPASLETARAYAGRAAATPGAPASLGLPLDVTLRRLTPPIRIDDLLRAAYQEGAARDLLARLGRVQAPMPRVARS